MAKEGVEHPLVLEAKRRGEHFFFKKKYLEKEKFLFCLNGSVQAACEGGFWTRCRGSPHPRDSLKPIHRQGLFPLGRDLQILLWRERDRVFSPHDAAYHNLWSCVSTRPAGGIAGRSARSTTSRRISRRTWSSSAWRTTRLPRCNRGYT